jgi:hypothetical protein
MMHLRLNIINELNGLGSTPSPVFYYQAGPLDIPTYSQRQTSRKRAKQKVMNGIEVRGLLRTSNTTAKAVEMDIESMTIAADKSSHD